VVESLEQNPSYKRILDAAQALFIEQGFPATSMEAIARRAKVVRATVYNNYQDKEAILGGNARRLYALGTANDRGPASVNSSVV